MFTRHRAHGFGLEDNRPWGDGVVTGHGTIDGRKVFLFSQDFTVFGGSLGEVFAEKIVQGHGPRREDGLPVHRHQRLGRRAHPGGRGQPGRLRGHLLPQRPRQRRHPADLGGHGPLRRRRRLQPGDHRLHLHGARDQPHVHHRPRGHQDGDRRGRDDGGAGRRPEPRHPLGRLPTSRPTPRRTAWSMVRELLSFLPQNNLDAAALRWPPPIRPDRAERRAGDDHPGLPDQALRHDRGDRAGRGRRRLLRGRAALRPEHRRGLRPAGRPRRWAIVGNQPKALAGVLDIDASIKARALRALLRRLQHPAGHVRGRARASCPAPPRSTAASSCTAPSCSTPTPRPRCRSSPSSRARPTAARTTS